mmetsp:Transcript_25601/g.65035  ORF Transcript_25601/g.65035 Transcript_25601/m.65035 type:complete len:255 (+) Transcript_25601:803-1567(+)
MSSVKASCSSLRSSVASATALSKAMMPTCKVLISSASDSMPSWPASMFASASETFCSNSFFVSSDISNCTPQYSFLWSSSTCSSFNVTIMSSTILMTFSKPTFLPLSARAMRSTRGLLPEFSATREALFTAARARARMDASLEWTCTKELAPGKVFLNKSIASSSLSTLMVSAMATISSPRVLVRSSQSAPFVEQPFSSSARNFWSAMRDSSASVSSFLSWAIATPRSPTFCDLVSIALVRANSSFFLAAMSSW